MTPTIGRIVHYCLTETDAEAINRRRKHARDHMPEHQLQSTGVQVHVGNEVAEGDIYPMMITKVWGPDFASAVNGQVFLDGNDLFWATSVDVGKGPGHFAWPVKT